MPSEYHAMKCHCRECSYPAETKRRTAGVLSLLALLGLALVSISVFGFVAYMTGGGL